jgi:RNA polymerase sigma-70 factor (ECF subfamily)
LLLVGAGDDAWREGDRERVLGALANLSDRYRDAITLRFLTGLTADEAAEAMECSKATFAVVLHRALTSLRREIGRQP